MSLTSSSKKMMKYQYDLNLKLANKANSWQEKMANSAHQREIADLKKAGLNPVLSVTGGNGANTPSGATASVGDAAGYAAAAANLEAAKINSATQRFMHTTPSANSIMGQINYVSEALGIPMTGVLGEFGHALNLDDNSSSYIRRIVDITSLKPLVDFYDRFFGKKAGGKTYSPFRFLRGKNSGDITDYFLNTPRRFLKHSRDFVDYKTNFRQYDRRTNADMTLMSLLAKLYPNEYKKVYGTYPYSYMNQNKKNYRKHAKRPKVSRIKY